MPYSALTGRKASSTNPATWATFEQAVRYERSNNGVAGIGFVVTEEDDWVGVDFDHIIDPAHVSTPEDTGIEPWSAYTIWRLASYTEVSPSGTGIRVFVRGKLPPGRRKCDIIEMYESARFLTVTGQVLAGSPPTVEERTAMLAVIHTEVFGAPEPESRPAPPRPATPPNFDDRELIDRAMNAANGGAFRALWNGDTSAHGSDDSGADLALCDHLAFWTAGAAAWMDSLFRQSGLYRAKWDEMRGQQTYGALTIAKAINGATAFYTQQPVGAPPPETGPQFMKDTEDHAVERFFGGW